MSDKDWKSEPLEVVGGVFAQVKASPEGVAFFASDTLGDFELHTTPEQAITIGGEMINGAIACLAAREGGAA